MDGKEQQTVKALKITPIPGYPLPEKGFSILLIGDTMANVICGTCDNFMAIDLVTHEGKDMRWCTRCKARVFVEESPIGN